jgi:hypothetical protein
MSVRTINDLFSAFASELEGLTLSAGRGELAAQIRELPVLDRCRCGQSNCAHFYTAPKPTGAYGPGHTNLMLPASRGLIVLDLVDGIIVAVEILDRPDVKGSLDAYISK